MNRDLLPFDIVKNPQLNDLEKIAKLTALNLTREELENFTTTDGCTLLHTATINSGIELAEWLLKECPKLLLKTNDYNTNVLFEAVKNSNLTLAEYFYKKNKNFAFGITKNKSNFLHLIAKGQLGITAVSKFFAEIKLNLTFFYTANSFGFYPHHIAAASGNYELLEEFIHLRQPINSFNEKGFNVLHLAIIGGHKAIVQKLIETSSLDIYKLTNNKGKFSPIELAAAYGRDETLKYLIETNTENVNELRKKPSNLLHRATDFIYNKVPQSEQLALYPSKEEAYESCYQTVAYLIKQKFDVNQKSENEAGLLPLCLAIKTGILPVIILLLKSGADPKKFQNDDTLAASHVAVKYNQLPALQLLLEKFPELINYCSSSKKCTPLHFAAGSNVEIINYLISKGATQVGDTQGMFPIHYAALNNNVNAMRIFIAHGATLTQLADDKDQNQPIHFAARNGALDVIKFLHENGVKLDSRNNQNNSPILLATSRNHYAVVNFILNIDKNSWQQCDNLGVTALHYAAKKKEKDSSAILELLIQKGASVDVTTQNGSTPLDYACSTGNLEATKIILAKNAKSIVKKDGHSPLHSAVEMGHFECAKFLLENTQEDLTKPVIRKTSDQNIMIPLIHQLEAMYINLLKRKSEHIGQELAKMLLVLLKYKVDINETDKNDLTVLHKISRVEKHPRLLAILSLLLKYGANPYINNDDGAELTNTILLNDFNSQTVNFINLSLHYFALRNWAIKNTSLQKILVFLLDSLKEKLLTSFLSTLLTVFPKSFVELLHWSLNEDFTHRKFTRYPILTFIDILEKRLVWTTFSIFGFKILIKSEELKIDESLLKSVEEALKKTNNPHLKYWHFQEKVTEPKPGYKIITGFCELKILNVLMSAEELTAAPLHYKVWWLQLLTSLLTYDSNNFSTEKLAILKTNALQLLSQIDFAKLNEEQKIKILYALLTWANNSNTAEIIEPTMAFLNKNYQLVTMLPLLLIAPYFLNNEVYLTHIYNCFFNAIKNFQQFKIELTTFFAKEKNYLTNFRNTLDITVLAATTGQKLNHIYIQLHQIATGQVPELKDISANYLLWNEFEFSETPANAESIIMSMPPSREKAFRLKFKFFDLPQSNKKNPSQEMAADVDAKEDVEKNTVSATP